MRKIPREAMRERLGIPCVKPFGSKIGRRGNMATADRYRQFAAECIPSYQAIERDFAMHKYHPLIIFGFMLLADAAANTPAVRVLPELIRAANAEGVAPETAPPATARTINITAEQRHIIKEIVLKAPNVEKVPADVDVTVGSIVPSTVAVQTFPTDVSTKVPQVKAHTFFVQGDKVIIVNPIDNKIAEVVD
jgi:hypothetical protein